MLCQENVKVTKRTTPRNCGSLNHKFRVCLSWRGELRWNKGEIVLIRKMQMEIPRLLAWPIVPTALDSTAISISLSLLGFMQDCERLQLSCWLFSFSVYQKSPNSHRATPVDTQTLSPAIKSRKAWIFVKPYHLPSTQLGAWHAWNVFTTTYRFLRIPLVIHSYYL